MINKKIFYQQFLNRENDTRHHRYDEEIDIQTQILEGNADAVEKALEMFTSDKVGHLSDDILNHNKYLFIATITLMSRHVISKGMNEELALITSDLYIQQVDKCKSATEILNLCRDMFHYYAKEMNNLNKKTYSKNIILCMDYIYYHLHEKFSVEMLADNVGLNPNYLSYLFKKETSHTVSEYITLKRMEAAKNMLLYSELSTSEIASILAYSTQSYFIKVFKNTYAYTPQMYRDKFFRLDLKLAHTDQNLSENNSQ